VVIAALLLALGGIATGAARAPVAHAATWGVVRSATVTGNGTTVLTTYAISLAGVGTGNRLIIAANQPDPDPAGAGTVSISDNAGNSYSQIQRVRNTIAGGGTGPFNVYHFTAQVATGGNLTITATLSPGTEYFAMSVTEVSGLNTSPGVGSVDVTAGATYNDTATTHSSGTSAGMTVTANEFAFATYGDNGLGLTITAGNIGNPAAPAAKGASNDPQFAGQGLTSEHGNSGNAATTQSADFTNSNPGATAVGFTVILSVFKLGPVRPPVPAFDHIIVFMMENHSFREINGNPDAPFINGLAAPPENNPVAVNYRGITHPSLPNYLTITGGNPFFVDNCSIAAGGCSTAASSIVDRIEASGRSWKAYMEDMPTSTPGTCFVGDNNPVPNKAPAYVERHNPFVHFDQIRNNAARCNRIVPYTQLAADLAALPGFVWITPNLCNDMHDVCDPALGEVKVGDNFLSTEVPRIRNSASCAAPQTCLIVITYDEGNDALPPPEDNHVYTLFVRPGAVNSAVAYTHYSLLRTIEDAWALAPLTMNDSNATAMADMF